MAVVLELDVEVPDLAEVEVETPDTEITPSGGATVVLVATPGPPGEQGPPGEGVQVFGETPTGDVDGVNTVFTTAANFRPTRIQVFLNGLAESYFTETGSNEITLDDPPHTGDDIRITYIIQ